MDTSKFEITRSKDGKLGLQCRACGTASPFSWQPPAEPDAAERAAWMEKHAHPKDDAA